MLLQSWTSRNTSITLYEDELGRDKYFMEVDGNYSKVSGEWTCLYEGPNPGMRFHLTLLEDYGKTLRGSIWLSEIEDRYAHKLFFIGMSPNPMRVYGQIQWQISKYQNILTPHMSRGDIKIHN